MDDLDSKNSNFQSHIFHFSLYQNSTSRKIARLVFEVEFLVYLANMCSIKVYVHDDVIGIVHADWSKWFIYSIKDWDDYFKMAAEW